MKSCLRVAVLRTGPEPKNEPQTASASNMQVFPALSQFGSVRVIVSAVLMFVFVIKMCLFWFVVQFNNKLILICEFQHQK